MQRRKFTREFKLEAVRLIRDRGVSVAQASVATPGVRLHVSLLDELLGGDPGRATAETQ